MTSDPAVSVIVSTRNRVHYLPEVLSTLRDQEGAPPYEVIVIDNGSTDTTAPTLAAWCRDHSRFRTALEPRPGLSRGKNAGIGLARAPLLLFTDDDVRVDRHWIAAYHVLFLQRGDAFTVFGGPIVPIPHDLGAWPPWLTDDALVDAGLLHHHQERELRRAEYVWGGNMAVPRAVFDRVGTWNESVGLQGERRVTREDSSSFEDTELQDRARQAGAAVWFCPSAVVHHRVNRRSITPRSVASMAFARGRNDAWRVERPPRQSAALSLGLLVSALVRWTVAASAFRLVKRQGAFDRTRAAAFATGRALETLRVGRASERLYRWAGRILFPLRSLVLRLTADGP